MVRLQICLYLHENPAGEKTLRTRRGAFLDIATHIQFPQVDIRVSVTTWSTFAAVKTHFGYTFTIPTSGNLLMRHLGRPGG